MTESDILSILTDVLNKKKGINGWTDLAVIGKFLADSGVNYKDIGYMKLRDLLDQYPGIIELKGDEVSNDIPVFYARLKGKDYSSDEIVKPTANQSIKGSPMPTERLWDWAYMGDFRKAIEDLENLALKERWHYKKQDPNNPSPILSNYLNYTFTRLCKEGDKIQFSERYAAFNTGLVDDLYEPIFAFFEKNKIPDKQYWFFQGFCISGGGRNGKLLARNFNPLPQRADFFNNPSSLIYDTTGPEPQLDWEHIILDNVERLPIELVEENRPSGFVFMDTSEMNEAQKKQYFKNLAIAIQADTRKFRAIKNRFSDSLSLALKRVSWNFKTAIPMYYPKNDKMSLLLPLSLVDDDVIDLALVTEKTESGAYLGHTILPLEWAYSNARLITRPDSDWLVAEKIDSSKHEEYNDD